MSTTSRRWATPRTRLTAAQQRATAHAQALAKCATGEHNETPTFRPGETVCLVCGRVIYCPDCLSENRLPLPQAHRAFPLLCSIHQKQEVQA
jgi:hypothetical protein